MSKLKFSISRKLHVLFKLCFFFSFRFHRCCVTAISHSGQHKMFSVKVGRKLKQFDVHIFRPPKFCVPVLRLQRKCKGLLFDKNARSTLFSSRGSWSWSFSLTSGSANGYDVIRFRGVDSILHGIDCFLNGEHYFAMFAPDVIRYLRKMIR